MTRSLTHGCIAAGLAALSISAAPAAAAVAPGHVVFSVATKVPESNVDAGGAGAAVTLPDGGSVMLAYDRASRDVAVARLRPDGALDPSFGRGGIARVAIPANVSGLAQILRQPDGRLIIVGTSSPLRSEYPRLVIARLTPGGVLDASFGNAGVITTAVQGSCGGCTPVSLAPDGSIVITGNTGKLTPTPTPTPTTGSSQWIVTRLAPNGAPDAAFGVRQIGAAGLNAGGYATVVRPDGRIVVLGTQDGAAKLAGLTAAGAPDPAFNAGQPATVSSDGFQLVLHTSGAVDVAGRDRVVRVTAAGALDATYGSGGSVAFSGFNASYGPPSMLATPDGGTILYGQTMFEPTPAAQPRLHLQRITPRGALGMAARPEPRVRRRARHGPGAHDRQPRPERLPRLARTASRRVIPRDRRPQRRALHRRGRGLQRRLRRRRGLYPAVRARSLVRRRAAAGHRPRAPAATAGPLGRRAAAGCSRASRPRGRASSCCAFATGAIACSPSTWRRPMRPARRRSGSR